jgi:peroxiredoxin Q/BCP
LGIDYPILSDPSKAVAKAYGVLGDINPFPSRWTFYIGADGRILDVDRRVKTSTHGVDIANQLEKLGVPRRADRVD